jgi:hypothetical protein
MVHTWGQHLAGASRGGLSARAKIRMQQPGPSPIKGFIQPKAAADSTGIYRSQEAMHRANDDLYGMMLNSWPTASDMCSCVRLPTLPRYPIVSLPKTAVKAASPDDLPQK